MTHERAQGLLKEAGMILTRCQQDFDAGRMVDVSPIEKTAHEFCEVLKSLPKDEAKLYEEPLHVMLEGLQALETLLSRKRDDLKGIAQGLNVQQRAQAAYRKGSPATDKP